MFVDITERFRKRQGEVVVRRVCDEFGITEEELTKNSRRRELVKARDALTIILRDGLTWTLQEVGDRVGGRTASTIMFAYYQGLNRCRTEARYRNKVQKTMVLCFSDLTQNTKTLSQI